MASALERDGAERSRYIALACGEDQILRAEVESLVRHAVAADGLAVLATGHAMAAAIQVADRQSRQPPVAEPPVQIGPYRVLGPLGGGGMGVVYRAEQLYPRRVVAVKVMAAGLADERALIRFQRESHVLGLLQHPGIAQIHDAGTVATELGSLPYIAMELVEGPGLVQYAREKQLDVASRCLLLASVCDAIQHAHERGVIHRDLKPQNVLVVEPTPGQPQPKVLDFGVAHAACGAPDATSLETRTGQILGTLPYMSPEQVSGGREQVDARTDVYALGVVLYELVTRRLPFDVSGKAFHEAVGIIATRSAPRLRRHDPALRGDLETIVETALAKERELRYASAAALAEDLRRFVDHEPIAARPQTTFYQLRKFARRNRALITSVAGTLVVLLAGLVAVALLAARNHSLAQSEGEHRRRAEAIGAELRQSLYFAQVRLAGGAFDRRGGSNVIRGLLPGWVPGPDQSDLRGWEWFWLYGASHQEEHRIQDWFPFGWLSWATADQLLVRGQGGVFLVRPGDGMQAAQPVATEPWAIQCDSTPDGERIVVTGLGHAGVFDRSGKRLVQFQVRDGVLPCLDPKRRWVAMHSQDRSLGPECVQIHELPGGAQTHVLGGEGASIGERPSVSGDGERLATHIREGNRIRIWNTHTWAPVHEFSAGAHVPAATGLQLSRDGRKVASGTRSGTVVVWDVQSGQLLHELRGHTQVVYALTWQPDDRGLASAGLDLDIRIWSLPSGQCRILGSHEIGVNRLAFSPEGDRLASLGGGELRTWRLDQPWAVRFLQPPHGLRVALASLRFSSHGRWLAGAPVTNDATALRAVQDGRIVDQVPGRHCALSHDDAYLAFVEGSRVSVRAVAQPQVLATHDFGAAVERLEWSPTEHTLAAGSAAAFRLWRWRPLAGEAPTVVNDPQLRFLRWHPDGRRIGSYSWTTRWIVSEPGEVPEAMARRLQVIQPRCQCVAFSPDGTKAAFGRDDAVVDVRDADGARTLLRLAGHTEAVLCLDWSPDGRRVASGSRDRSVRVWDAVRGEETVTVPCGASVAAVAWSPDGRVLAVGTEDGGVRLFDATPGQEKAARLHGQTSTKQPAEPSPHK